MLEKLLKKKLVKTLKQSLTKIFQVLNRDGRDLRRSVQHEILQNRVDFTYLKIINVMIAVKHLTGNKSQFLKISDSGTYFVGFPAMQIMEL